ncbi:OmpA family protein [Hyphococcus lacteus]|uniref:OmpA family protein n=1 Tax=Hyphococcus lacteus TaxID=3143536 RepID=A0ABV3Z8G0_9PROT
MNAIIKISFGLIAVALLGAAAFTSDIIPGSASSAEQRLLTKANAALSNTPSIRLQVNGQKLIISGEVPDIETRTRTLARIENADGPGGIVIGGITTIDASALKVIPQLPVADPFIWIAENEGDALVFSGFAPSEAARNYLFQLAEELFGNHEISGTLELASGLPATENQWLKSTDTALRSLSLLKDGVAEANGIQFSLSGEAQDIDSLNKARTSMENVADVFQTQTQLNLRRTPTSIEDLITETVLDDPIISSNIEEPAQTEAVAQLPSCQSNIETAIDQRKIGFSSALADIDINARTQLREIASILADCENIRLQITGHTDSSGNAARNLQLSGYRADAVRAFLISVGAPANRLSTRGAGSAEPITSNATPEGRERNRRIEIEVVSENG